MSDKSMILLFVLLTLLGLAVPMAAFAWGWSRLGTETGFYVLLMVYGYTAFSLMVREITERVRELRKARA